MQRIISINPCNSNSSQALMMVWHLEKNKMVLKDSIEAPSFHHLKKELSAQIEPESKDFSIVVNSPRESVFVEKLIDSDARYRIRVEGIPFSANIADLDVELSSAIAGIWKEDRIIVDDKKFYRLWGERKSYNPENDNRYLKCAVLALNRFRETLERKKFFERNKKQGPAQEFISYQEEVRKYNANSIAHLLR